MGFIDTIKPLYDYVLIKISMMSETPTPRIHRDYGMSSSDNLPHHIGKGFRND